MCATEPTCFNQKFSNGPPLPLDCQLQRRQIVGRADGVEGVRLVWAVHEALDGFLAVTPVSVCEKQEKLELRGLRVGAGSLLMKHTAEVSHVEKAAAAAAAAALRPHPYCSQI